jgi:hypothetical protein
LSTVTLAGGAVVPTITAYQVSRADVCAAQQNNSELKSSGGTLSRRKQPTLSRPLGKQPAASATSAAVDPPAGRGTLPAQCQARPHHLCNRHPVPGLILQHNSSCVYTRIIEMKITSGSEWVPLVGVSKILLKLRSIIFIKFQNPDYFKVRCLCCKQQP